MISQSGRTISLRVRHEILREWRANPDQEAAHVENIIEFSRAMQAVQTLQPAEKEINRFGLMSTKIEKEL